ESSEWSELSPLSPFSTFPNDVEQAIAATLPKKPKRLKTSQTPKRPQTKNSKEKSLKSRKVFELVRRLKAILGMEYDDYGMLRLIVREWHRRAVQGWWKKAFSETWSDFLYGWGKAESAFGCGTIEAAFERSKKMRPPKIAVDLYGADDIRVLGLVCL